MTRLGRAREVHRTNPSKGNEHEHFEPVCRGERNAAVLRPNRRGPDRRMPQRGQPCHRSRRRRVGGWSHGGARLSEQLRPISSPRSRVSGFYAKGVDALSKLSTQAVQAVVKAATAGVDRLSGRVTSLEAMLAPLPLSSAIVIVQPIAAAGRDASGFVAARARQTAAARYRRRCRRRDACACQAQSRRAARYNRPPRLTPVAAYGCLQAS